MTTTPPAAAAAAGSPTSGAHHNQRGEFLKCLGEFFKRDLISIPVVKKFPHAQLSQRCNLKAVTLELDTAAYPNIEYIAGTRLSVYPLNPAQHVAAIMEHLVDDLDRHQVMVNNWNKFAKLNGKDTLRLALTYLFDIMTAPSRELIRLLADACREKDQRKKLVAVSLTNESWERWLCSGHRTLKALFEEHNSCKVNASVLLNELNVQQPRQYSISNIKSAKRFRAEIVVVQHKFSLRQIELNLRQLRDRETYERTFSPTASSTSSPPPVPLSQLQQQQVATPPPQPPGQVQQPPAGVNATTTTTTPQMPGSKSNSRSLSQGASRSPAPGSSIKSTHTVKSAVAQSTTSLPLPVTRRPGPSTPPPVPLPPPVVPLGRSPSRPPQSAAAAVAQQAQAQQRNSSKGSQASNRSVRSMASFASSPITTHQVRRVSSFSGPLMSAYANATASQISSMSMISSIGQSASGQSGLERSGRPEPKSLLSVLESQNRTINSETGVLNATASAAAGGGGPGHSQKYDGLCSNYLLGLNSNDLIVCEFVENPRFTLKGNRERPIMLIGQDVGMIAYRAFWQQRHLEHDRAQVFYSLFKDLSPKKFGDMQLVCLTGHRGRVEELFKREIQQALASKILSSYTCINRKHLLAVLAAATNKSQLVLTQLQQQQSQLMQQPSRQQLGPSAIKSTMQQPQQQINAQNQQNLPINSKELLELGDRIYKLLVENNGCLYTCCDPHMTQAIEILAFESIARNNSSLTREKLMKLLPKWKGRTQADERADETPSFFTLENTYERAAIVQEIYDSSI